MSRTGSDAKLARGKLSAVFVGADVVADVDVFSVDDDIVCGCVLIRVGFVW